MKHFKKFQMFESSTLYKPGGAFVVDDLLKLYKERIQTCKDIAKEYGYVVIAELMDNSSIWKTYIVLEDEDSTDVEYFNQKKFSDVNQKIRDLLPSIDKHTGKRFLSYATYKSFGMTIEEWQKSDILVKANSASGVLEKSEYVEYPCIEVYMDWA